LVLSAIKHEGSKGSSQPARFEFNSWIVDSILIAPRSLRDIDLTHGVEEFLGGDNEIRVNLEAPIILSAMLIPLLARNPQSALINVSSGLGFVPMANMPVYCASKAGMHAFSMAIRVQLAKLGMKVFEVVPPMVDTALNPMGRAKRGGFKAGLGPQDFVAGVMQGLANDVPEIGYGMTLASVVAVTCFCGYRATCTGRV
jgi:uncharacterized oxidoreductase